MSGPTRIIDLTQPLKTGLPGVEITSARTVAKDGWNATNLRLYSHCGTHMDARIHFDAGNETIDQIPLERCMGRAWVARIECETEDCELQPGQLGPLAENFPAGESLLLATGWSQQPRPIEERATTFPVISDALATWCVEHKVKLLGVEQPSVGEVKDLNAVTRIHKILLGGGVTIVEGLVNLDQIGKDAVWFMALPLKVAGGDGAPVRAMAIEGQPPQEWLTGLAG